MPTQKYLKHYPETLVAQVDKLIANNKLGEFLLSRYPSPHGIVRDSDLREFLFNIKNEHMRQSGVISKVTYDNKLHVEYNALGTHHFVSRVQGGKLKSKNEIRISSLFKSTALPILNMIVVHELAHLKEKEHNKAFYRLCTHMLPEYFQLELDARLFLIYHELNGVLYR